MKHIVRVLCLASLWTASTALPSQAPFLPPSTSTSQQSPDTPEYGHGYGHGCQLVPHVNYTLEAGYEPNGVPADLPDMTLFELHVSGPSEERVNLAFFADGYTPSERAKFIQDAKALTADIVSANGSMAHVADLLNVWGVFVGSNSSGIGHNTPLPGSPFGLYRNGPELRGVMVGHQRTARAACAYWRHQMGLGGQGGCDQPILLGNDGLYGGLGGEFTVITASKLNGPLVLRHELGHSLIEVGEEYEGGWVYSGVNSDRVENIDNLKWASFLTHPENPRIEDVKVPLQAYPWHDLDSADWGATFESANTPKEHLHEHKEGGEEEKRYPTAFLRVSLSSIPYATHIDLLLDDAPLDISPGFPSGEWEGTKDRRWVQVDLPPLSPGNHTFAARLTSEGHKAEAGQGGKMITSVEILEYAGEEAFNATKGFVGAFPTYALDGSMTLRPTNEECLMRDVTYPHFCPVCKDGLERKLKDTIRRRKVRETV